jgi:hypothetical protein
MSNMTLIAALVAWVAVVPAVVVFLRLRFPAKPAEGTSGGSTPSPCAASGRHRLSPARRPLRHVS